MPASPIPYANDLDIAPDGTIYFTDSSHFGPALHPQLGFFDTLRACVLTMAQVLPGRPCFWAHGVQSRGQTCRGQHAPRRHNIQFLLCRMSMLEHPATAAACQGRHTPC